VRLLPLLTLSYLAAYIDRRNVACAKLQMLDSLHLNASIATRPREIRGESPIHVNRPFVA
jgi:hypothetical protein